MILLRSKCLRQLHISIIAIKHEPRACNPVSRARSAVHSEALIVKIFSKWAREGERLENNEEAETSLA